MSDEDRRNEFGGPQAESGGHGQSLIYESADPPVAPRIGSLLSTSAG
jgi:hypothetical protein